MAGLVAQIERVTRSWRDDVRRPLRERLEQLKINLGIPAVAVFAAGLPNSPDVIAPAVTFSERFAYRRLERLSEDAVLVALTGPARTLGVAWDDDALDMAVAQAQGYPYTVDVLFRTRWQKASAGERQLIRAIASFGDGPVRRADVARAMDLSTQELSVPRARLIDKGLIEVVAHGELSFTIPGFAAYVRGNG